MQNADWDIAGAGEDEELISAARKAGFKVDAVYQNTGTVRLSDPLGIKYEFTRFRSDKYVRGLHAPAKIEFTTDIKKDAARFAHSRYCARTNFCRTDAPSECGR